MVVSLLNCGQDKKWVIEPLITKTWSYYILGEFELRLQNECILKDYVVTPSLNNIQVKVLARLPFGHQLFWFRQTFLQIKMPAPKF